MKTKLITDITIKKLCEGFVYSEFEGKGLFGLNGILTIQPEYQRNYIYAEEKKDIKVIDSVLKGYPLGIIYFVKNNLGKLEVLDGQQRITSIGRFVTNKLSIVDENNKPQLFSSLSHDVQEQVLNTTLFIYECEGEESEIKKWFKTINIVGVPLNDQELNNAIYSGNFLNLARKYFNITQHSSELDRRCQYIKGNVKRQEHLERALHWVSKGNITEYMSEHRHDTNINEISSYFETILDWIDSTFENYKKEMKGLEWGELYEEFHTIPYNPSTLSKRVDELFADEHVSNKKGIFKYVLGGEQDTKLLHVRLFDKKTIQIAYNKQTEDAKQNNYSNCPLCKESSTPHRTKIWELSKMDADHITAWSKGGGSSQENCQMLCKTHNQAKGNK